MSSKCEDVRRAILHKWLENKEKSFSQIAREVKTTRWTVSRIIKKFLETETIAGKPKSGRPKGTTDKTVEKKVLKFIEMKKSVSVRDVAKKFNISKSTVDRIKKRHNIKTFKKQKSAKRTVKQENIAKSRARKLYATLCEQNCACLILDDESYFKYDFSTLPGPQYYSAKNKKEVPDAEKYVFVEKFGKKVLVWQAICQCGRRSKPLFFEGCINTDIYINECLKKGLLPFIKLHNVPTLFWPDLATSHYAARTITWYQKNKIKFVQKSTNPPNVPQLRPIERYWALVKNILRKEGKSATSLKNFAKMWTTASKKVEDSTVQKLMASVKRKVRAFIRKE